MNSNYKNETTRPNSAFIGIDVSKQQLDIYMPGGSRNRCTNSTKALDDLAKQIKSSTPNAHVICEATGGYERLLVRAMHKATVVVSVVQPGRVRHYALAEGILAKTDKIDAELIARFGEKINPRPDIEADPQAVKLREMLEARRVVLDAITENKRRLELAEGYLATQLKSLTKSLERQLERIEADITKHTKSSEIIQSKCQRMQQLKGVGPVLSASLIAYVPELGELSNKTISSIIGIAPHPRDSGKFVGKRSIRGGRSQVRHVLYMAAVAAARSNPILKEFYSKMINRGKPAKVALVAVMRKMICVLNKLIADPEFTLA